MQDIYLEGIDKSESDGLTLEEFTALLENMERHGVKRLGFTIFNPHSYRYCYEEIAFETMLKPQPIEEAISVVLSAVGEEFTGYRGESFYMSCTTPANFCRYGESSGCPVSLYVIRAIQWVQLPPKPSEVEQRENALNFLSSAVSQLDRISEKIAAVQDLIKEAKAKQ